MLCLVFGLSLVDRTNISSAFIAGMDVSLKLTGAQYNVALLVFFIGYGLFEVWSTFPVFEHWLTHCHVPVRFRRLY